MVLSISQDPFRIWDRFQGKLVQLVCNVFNIMHQLWVYSHINIYTAASLVIIRLLPQTPCHSGSWPPAWFSPTAHTITDNMSQNNNSNSHCCNCASNNSSAHSLYCNWTSLSSYNQSRNLKPKGTTLLSLVSRCQPSLTHQMPQTLCSIPAITIPVNGHWTLDDRDVQFFLKNKRQSLKFHYSLWLWPQQVQATVGHQRSYRCTDVRPHQILNSLFM